MSSTPGKACAECGEPVPASKRARPRRFCTDACRIKFNNKIRDKAKKNAIGADWARRNPQKVAATRKRYRARHPEKYQALKRKWFKKYQDDIWFRRLLKRKGILSSEEIEGYWARRESLKQRNGQTKGSV